MLQLATTEPTWSEWVDQEHLDAALLPTGRKSLAKSPSLSLLHFLICRQLKKKIYTQEFQENWEGYVLPTSPNTTWWGVCYVTWGQQLVFWKDHATSSIVSSWSSVHFLFRLLHIKTNDVIWSNLAEKWHSKISLQNSESLKNPSSNPYSFKNRSIMCLAGLLNGWLIQAADKSRHELQEDNLKGQESWRKGFLNKKAERKKEKERGKGGESERTSKRVRERERERKKDSNFLTFFRLQKMWNTHKIGSWSETQGLQVVL